MMLAARVVVLLVGVLAVLNLGRAEAGGPSYVLVSPLSGPPGTTVEVTGRWWTPDAEVEISAAYTAVRFGEPDVLGEVIATTMSDEDGNWTVEVELGKDLPVPDRPGFVEFRAVSEEMPGYHNPTTKASFALVVDGQRPNGAGGMRVSISQAPGLDTRLVFLGIRRAGSDTGFRNRLSVGRDLPAEVMLKPLGDGDYEVAAQASGSLFPVGPGLTDVVADACDEPICEGVDRRYRVQVVSIRNGEIVDVHVTFGEPALPDSGHGPHESGGWYVSWLMASLGLAAAGSMLWALAMRQLLRRPPGH